MPDIETAHPEQRPRDLKHRHLTYRVVAMPAGSILAFQAASGRIATVAV